MFSYQGRMTYPSIDKLQKALSSDVFGDRADTKKAAGRALGTILELISYYLVEAWEIGDAASIELRVPEYGNPEITHNVEFAMHPIVDQESIDASKVETPLTSAKIFKLSKFESYPKDYKKNTSLLSSNSVKRNGAVIYNDGSDLLIASYHEDERVVVTRLDANPYAIIECKRVGVEEGAKKGPTTIEKAKQGAYVAKSVSRLQKFRGYDGKLMGIYPKSDGTYEINEYQNELDRIVDSYDPNFTEGLTLSVGIVSNHGNWFTDEALNKELLVLKSSYDWLLFFSDEAMVGFVTNLLLSEDSKYKAIKDAFAESYAPGRKENVFTKVKIKKEADKALRDYFSENLKEIEEKWFSVLQPENKKIGDLKITMKKLYDQRDKRKV